MPALRMVEDLAALEARSGFESIEFYEPKHGLEIEVYLEREEKQGIHHLGRYHWAKEVLAPRNPRTILDIACGPGMQTMDLADLLPDAEITAVAL